MIIQKNKLLILLLLLFAINPIFSKEPYFQKTQQKSLMSVLGTVSPLILWNTNNQLELLEGIGGVNVEFYGRATKANVFATFKVKGIFNFSNNYIVKTSDFFLYSGIGGFLFDKRSELGIGSFMTMSFNLFFYPFTYYIGMGVSLDTRYSYAFHPTSAFTLGIDLQYRVSDFGRNNDILGFHILEIGFVFGFTFNTK